MSIDFGSKAIDDMLISNSFLYLGCSQCNTVYGQINMYDIDSLEELEVFYGDEETLLTGLHMGINDMGDYVEVYYTSQWNANISYREYNIGVV